MFLNTVNSCCSFAIGPMPTGPPMQQVIDSDWLCINVCLLLLDSRHLDARDFRLQT